MTVGFLMQIDKLVHLLESPIFVHLRLQLLDAEAVHHTHLLKSCYGLLMLLPQSNAFRSLNHRLETVCNLRDNLGVRPPVTASPRDGAVKMELCSSIYQVGGLDVMALIDRFDEVMELHRSARRVIVSKAAMQVDQGGGAVGVGGGVGVVGGVGSGGGGGGGSVG